MATRLFYLVFIASFLSISGCASLTAIPVKPGDSVSGIRVYGSRPILVVTAQKADIIMVPNHNEQYAIQFNAFLSKNKSKLTIKNGMLEGDVEADLDSTAAIELLRDIAKGLIDKIVSLSKPAAGDNKGVGAPQRFAVFAFVFDEAGEIKELRPLVAGDDLIHVPANSEVKSDLFGDSQTPKAAESQADVDNLG